MRDNRERLRYLEFSCQLIEFSLGPGEIMEDSLTIYAPDRYAQGKILSSDTRMRVYETEFKGESSQIGYCFDATGVSAGSNIRGELVIISNYGEYSIPYQISVQRPLLQCSLGAVKNLFHFTNLAQANWEEAVALFYSWNFASVLQKSDRNAYLSYVGLSRYRGNEQNVEEFLIEVNKKTPIIYSFDIEGFLLEDVQDSIDRTVIIRRSGWGYSFVRLQVAGEFIRTDKEILTDGDFEDNACALTIHIDATRLHNGMNSGSVLLSDACNDYTIPVDILMEEEPERRIGSRKKRQALCNMTSAYASMRSGKITDVQWQGRFEKELDVLLEYDEDCILHNLFRTQLLIGKERFNEAKWYLDMLEQRLSKDQEDVFLSSYYLYLTTLINCAEEYVRDVCNEIETAYANHPSDWRLGWFILQIDEDLERSRERKWQFMEEMFENGCSSRLMLCEALSLLQEHPTFLLKLEDFEENVLWYGARHQLLRPELIEQLQYLVARKKEYSVLLFRILCEVYRTYKSPQTVASICHILILGDKKGVDYYHWYALGVECSVRVTGLYEYYMMSLELDKYGDIMGDIEIPKIVLMYFAYQSTLDYELNAFLYAYVIRNRDRYPDLEQSYRIAIERFVVDQIKAGHINENLAYLYKNMLAPQMIADETAYAYTPLLFMHRIYVDNPKVKSIVVIHEKVNGESAYPVISSVCMIPIYGSEYKLFLQDADGNRFTKSIGYENKQLMVPEKQLAYVSGYMQGRLSFDIYLCEVDKNYITISQDNVRRFKNLAESPQVVESFKKEIRTKLLRFYYDNDMIGELDSFLEDIEADEMEVSERAEFIRYLISRGMFEKAYYWIRAYGVAGVESKAVARLVSKRIVSGDFGYEEFLVNVAFYIYKNMKYDENILRYLMLNYEGKVTDLRKLWRSAVDLELDAEHIMERILRQIKYTGAAVSDRDSILVSYARSDGADPELVNDILTDIAYEYFVYETVVCPEIFDMLYQKHAEGEPADRVCRLALLKYWAEDRQGGMEIPSDAVVQSIQEFIRDEIYFPFYVKLADMVPELHYIRNSAFIEYRTQPGSQVYIHFTLDDGAAGEDSEDKDTGVIDRGSYEIEEMREMYEGIHVSMFQLFHGETLQYYITETFSEDGAPAQEHVTQSDTLSGRSDVARDTDDRFDLLNDIMVSASLQDEATAQQLMEEYLYQDFCVRELFRVL